MMTFSGRKLFEIFKLQLSKQQLCKAESCGQCSFQGVQGRQDCYKVDFYEYPSSKSKIL